MDALVVGCGYLGSRVASLWRAAGHRVFVTTRLAAKANEIRDRGWEPVICDLTVPTTLASLPRVDVVVTAFALDRSSGSSMRQLYVDGMSALAKAMPPPSRWIHVSSSSVYGQTDGGWVDETSATEPEELAGIVVRETEAVLQQSFPEAMILRFSGIYGPGRLLRRKSIEAGEPIVGDADKWLNLIHVDDGAAAVIAAAERGMPSRIYNVCDDEPVRRRDFYTAMAAMLGAPPPKFVAPPTNAPTPPHERGNRRIRNRRLREELQVEISYPNFRLGLQTLASRER